MTNFISELTFFFQRFDLLSAVDVLLVTMAVFFLLRLVRGTQAVALLRGMIVLVITIAVLTSLLNLPAFTWLLEASLPALLIAIPVIFAPEIRRALERLGRTNNMFFLSATPDHIEALIETVCVTAQRLSDRRYGALIVIEREIPLADYKETGVTLDAELTPQLLLQIFHINTPLHDGAAIIEKDRIAAAGCVMPLSSSGTLSRSTDRSMGLRHRAALGISEVSDAVSVVVSEETGGISVTHNGRMIRRLDQARLKNILTAFFRPRTTGRFPGWLERFLARTQGERESKQ
ncbi:MAG: TIGR00159 family protein [Anaerolineales bacterium]|nr:MAG: TIGR00159 family protein [Anaerolineales bacterium]